MKIEFDKDSEGITLIPENKYPNRKRELHISFYDDMVVFTFQEQNQGSNIQISLEEWYQLKRMFDLMKG